MNIKYQMQQSKLILLILIICITSIGCAKYIHTPSNIYRVSAQEYRLEKQNERISRKIESQLGIRKASDSLFLLCLTQNPPQEAQTAMYNQLQMVSSAYRDLYVGQDTVGEFHRFEAVFSDHLKNAIADYSSFLRQKTDGQIWIIFYEKDGAGYFYLMQGPILPTNADGYALYDNRIQISVFDTLKYAKHILRLKKMKKYPYHGYRRIGEYAEGNYDGPLDVYRIRDDNSIERIGRGYLDEQKNFISN